MPLRKEAALGWRPTVLFFAAAPQLCFRSSSFVFRRKVVAANNE